MRCPGTARAVGRVTRILCGSLPNVRLTRRAACALGPAHSAPEVSASRAAAAKTRMPTPIARSSGA